MSSSELPVPQVTPELAPFFAAAKEGKLVVQRCKGCGARRMPPRPLCSACLSRESEWVGSSGKGRVFSFHRMHQVYHPGFADRVPYLVALVELEDGGRLLASLVDCAAETARVGLPVEVAFEPRGDVSLPVFRPRA